MFHFVYRQYKVQQTVVASDIFKNSVCQNLGVRARKRRSVRIWLICLFAGVNVMREEGNLCFARIEI
jgi:hypothetical protein